MKISTKGRYALRLMIDLAEHDHGEYIPLKEISSAEEYTAGEILRVTEGGLAPIACLTESAEICPRNSTCETLDFWVGLGKAIDNYVDSVSLEDLVLQHQKKLENQG